MTEFPTPPDYEALEIIRRGHNCSKVAGDLECNNYKLNTKIDRFSRNFGYSFDSVKEKIKKDKMFAAHFAEDPTKQQFYQREASEYINKLDVINDFKSLITSWKKTWHIDKSGKIFYRNKQYKKSSSNKELLKKPNPSEALDFSKALNFYWKISNYECYASYEYTKMPGGMQNRKYNSIKKALEYYKNGGSKENVIFFAICDGCYYKNDDSKKLKELKEIMRTEKPKSYVLTSNEMYAVLKNIVND